MSELKVCPFCGSNDIGGAGGIISCYECGAETSKHPDTELAGLSWNNRVRFSTVEGMQLVSEEAISYLHDHWPSAYKEFYARLDNKEDK